MSDGVDWTSAGRLYTRAISERFREKGLITKRYVNSPVYFFNLIYFTIEELRAITG